MNKGQPITMTMEEQEAMARCRQNMMKVRINEDNKECDKIKCKFWMICEGEKS